MKRPLLSSYEKSRGFLTSQHILLLSLFFFCFIASLSHFKPTFEENRDAGNEVALGVGMIPKLIGAALICGEVLAGQPTCQFECNPGQRLECKWTGCGNSRSCIQSNPNSVLKSNRICKLKGGASSDSPQIEDQCCKCEPTNPKNEQRKDARSPADAWDDDIPPQGTFIVPPFSDPPTDKDPPYDIINPQNPLPNIPPYEHPGLEDNPDPEDIPDFPGIDAIIMPGTIDEGKPHLEGGSKPKAIPFPPSSPSKMPAPPKTPSWPGNKATAQKIFDFHLDHYRDHRTFEAIRLRDDIDYEDAGTLSFTVVKSELDHKGTLYKGLLTDAMQFSGLLFTLRLKQNYPHLLEYIKSYHDSNQDVSFSLKKFEEEFFQPALEGDTLTIVTEVEKAGNTWISLIHKVFLTKRGLAEFASSNPVIIRDMSTYRDVMIASAISTYDYGLVYE